MKRFVLAVAVLGTMMAPARGSLILVDNSPPDNVTAYASNVNLGSYLANSFTLGSAGTVNGVNFWGIFGFGGPPTSFTVNLFADAAGQPGTLLSTSSGILAGTPNGGTTVGLQDYLFQSSFTGVPLTAGTYWLSVYGTNPNDGFYWVTHSQAGSFGFTYGSPTAGPWSTSGQGTLAFQILGADVPEIDPGSAMSAFAVMAMGVAMIRGRRRSA